MLGKCPVCEKKHPLKWSVQGIRVLQAHDTCNGSGLEPVKYSIVAERSKILPKWVSDTIAFIAYEHGHSAGDEEVATLEEGMIADFETAFKKENPQ